MGEKTQNSPRMRQLGLYIPKMVSGSEIGPLGTDLGPSREIVILPISEGQKKNTRNGTKAPENDLDSKTRMDSSIHDIVQVFALNKCFQSFTQLFI